MRLDRRGVFLGEGAHSHSRTTVGVVPIRNWNFRAELRSLPATREQHICAVLKQCGRCHMCDACDSILGANLDTTPAATCERWNGRCGLTHFVSQDSPRFAFTA